MKRRRDAHRLAYIPWLVVTGVFGAVAAADLLQDPMSLLALVPFLLVCGHLYYPTVLGWAVLSVPAVIGGVVVAFSPQRYLSTWQYLADITCLLGPALCVMSFPPRIRRDANGLLWIVAVMVGLVFCLVLGAFGVLNRPDVGKKPPRRLVEYPPRGQGYDRA